MATSRKPAGKAASKVEEIELPLRVTLARPPSGVQFCLQGKTAADLEQQQISDGGDLSFDFSIRVAPGGTGSPRFLGPYTQGPAGAKFVYLCVGTLAGQADSGWSRRVKVPLSSLTQKLIDRVRRSPAVRLEGRVWGTAKDGGPVCASVPLMDDGWRVID